HLREPVSPARQLDDEIPMAAGRRQERDAAFEAGRQERAGADVDRHVQAFEPIDQLSNRRRTAYRFFDERTDAALRPHVRWWRPCLLREHRCRGEHDGRCKERKARMTPGALIPKSLSSLA